MNIKLISSVYFLQLLCIPVKAEVINYICSFPAAPKLEYQVDTNKNSVKLYSLGSGTSTSGSVKVFPISFMTPSKIVWEETLIIPNYVVAMITTEIDRTTSQIKVNMRETKNGKYSEVKNTGSCAQLP